jgi:hypothetical protein
MYVSKIADCIFIPFRRLKTKLLFHFRRRKKLDTSRKKEVK